MSARERAHPWWVEPLPPYDDGWGGDSITVRMAPLCTNCGEGLTGHYAFVDYKSGWTSPFLCKRPLGATEETVVWKETQ